MATARFSRDMCAGKRPRRTLGVAGSEGSCVASDMPEGSHGACEALSGRSRGPTNFSS